MPLVQFTHWLTSEGKQLTQLGEQATENVRVAAAEVKPAPLMARTCSVMVPVFTVNV